jgi:NADH-quinone oxidoreductase subunit K
MEAFEQITINHYVYLSFVLFCLGIIGVLTRRNAIVIFMSVELMLNAVNLLLVAYSTYLGDVAGQMMVFFIMTVAAAEVAIGLAIIVLLYRNTRSIDINISNKLRH